MAKIYKVWIEIEEIDEDIDHYETLDGVEIGVYDTKKEARESMGNIQRTFEYLGDPINI